MCIYLYEVENGLSSLHVDDVQRQILKKWPLLYLLAVRKDMQEFVNFGEILIYAQYVDL